MRREDLEKLVGGYATGTLTPEEQRQLFEAALDDQELFEALAREQSLRELLSDPSARAQVLEAASRRHRFGWLRIWARPDGRLSVARPIGALAAACVVGIGIYALRQGPAPAPRVEIAAVRQAEPSQPLPSAAAPAAPPAAVPAPAPSAVRKKEAAPAGAVPQAAPPPAREMLMAEARAPEKPAETAEAAEAATAPPQAALGSQAAAGERGEARTLYYGAAGAADSAQKSAAAANSAPAPIQAMSAPVLRTGIAAHLGLKYTVLRQAADGSMVEAGPDFLFRADTVRVRFEPNDNGYLTVAEAGASGPLRQIAAARVERGRPFEALLPAASGAGTRSLVVSFSREPSPAGLGGGQPADTAAPARTDQQVETGPAQRTTYVVARDAAPAAQRVTFTITLNYR